MKLRQYLLSLPEIQLYVFDHIFAKSLNSFCTVAGYYHFKAANVSIELIVEISPIRSANFLNITSPSLWRQHSISLLSADLVDFDFEFNGHLIPS